MCIFCLTFDGFFIFYCLVIFYFKKSFKLNLAASDSISNLQAFFNTLLPTALEVIE